MEHIQYPTGRFDFKKIYTDEEVQKAILEVKKFPSELKLAVAGLTPEQLDTPYREGGWTIKQVVHHLADTQMNGYIRIKKALTSENPDIMVYDQAQWAEMPDAVCDDLSASLMILEGVIARMVMLLETLTPEDWDRCYHREGSGLISLRTTINIYAFHGKHHLAHIAMALK